MHKSNSEQKLQSNKENQSFSLSLCHPRHPRKLKLFFFIIIKLLSESMCGVFTPVHSELSEHVTPGDDS